MSWEQRSYYREEPEYQAGGGGLRSWFAGLPPLSKAVKWIIIANTAMFLICQVSGRDESPIFQFLSMNTVDAIKRLQLWRLFTFTYLHDQHGLMHILFNMIGLYFLGVPLERTWGTRRFFLFYTLGGFVGVALYVLVTLVGWLNPAATIIGASGGVLAVLGACAVLFPQMQLILVFFPVPIRILAIIYVVIYSFNLFNQGSNAGGDACHLAGIAFGIYWGYRGHRILGGFDRMREKAQEGRWEAKRQRERNVEMEIDRILLKVKQEGINSLSRGEKKTLEEATKRKQGV